MEKQQFMYAVGALNRHANPAHFQVLLAQLDDELPGHHLNPPAAEALAMPPSKRGWRTVILQTRDAVKESAL
jgi:hypothetical protein